MLKAYALVAAIITLLLDIPFEVFKQPYSWWLVPTIMIASFIALILLHVIVLALSVLAVNLNAPPHDTDLFRLIKTGFLHLVIPILRVKIHTTGLEKVPADEPFLLVCNHLSELDPAIIYYAIPDSRLAFIAKKEVKELYPFVFKALHKLSGLSIDRENNREAVKTIVNATKLIKNKTNSVAVFPEGYVSLSGELLPIRNGALKIATKAQAKIVVCTIWGTRKIGKTLLRKQSHVYFDVLDVIDTADNSQTVELGDQIHSIMLENLNKVKQNENA